MGFSATTRAGQSKNLRGGDDSGHGGGPAAFHLILRFVAASLQPRTDLCFAAREDPRNLKASFALKQKIILILPAKNRARYLCDTGSSRFL
jgi:hypothetical protein